MANTGVPHQYIESIAREFADIAHKTHGRSMIILGAGVNHWYHMDMNYRRDDRYADLCGCVGQSGGGWAHYVGQEPATNRLVATGLCARLEPTTAPNEQHLVFLQSFQPMAL
ncbi:molybdopterin-dependent oxidoreductase [Escherichia coli]